MANNTHIYDLCKEHMHAYVLTEMTDGTQMDGIITGLDDEYVYLAVPNDYSGQYVRSSNHQNNERQFGGFGPGYGYGYGPGYGFGPGYGYGPGFGYPGGRFRRAILPLAAIAAISLLPWY